ncbi:Phosphatidylglycerol/phosphatidylinositol transfer protein [Naganishia friedmannii]|uniref:Phosphatidylglycerol/phosphatidylinositol transfer protein n=1 Tax=Naganishia friedmannii TaxID=89922 RepID=A0ACC2VMD7_9TREE|nr:Phosphatidylglycerol/phosphatidylinositol transfer protein [Naganishia friedmannii]
MKFLTISSLILASSAFVCAVPAPAPAPVGEGLIDLASWSAQKVADQFTAVEDSVKDVKQVVVERVKDGGMVAMGGWSWTDCGLATDAVQIKEINVNPDPPAPGKNLTVNVKAEVLKTIDEGAWAHVVVKLGLIKLLQKDFDICEVARDNNATVQCPILPGSYDITQTVQLPREIPRAKFAVNVQAYDKDDEDLACVNLFVDFLPHRG